MSSLKRLDRLLDKLREERGALIGGEQGSVTTPVQHALALHGSGEGLVAVGRKLRGRWKEKAYPSEELDEVLPALAGKSDVYVSQNRFYGWRGVSRLAELSALYADLDYYRVADLVDMQVQGVFSVAMEQLERAQIPYPSLAISTGRGLALVWLHTSVSRAELSRWSLCQRHIWEALRSVGADRAATDAARVLRVVGTVNSRSGSRVETCWENTEVTWDFDDLANEVLPLTKEELEEINSRRASKRSKRNTSFNRRREGIIRRFSVATLNQARLEDLHRLMDLRGWDRLPPGSRDSWMLIAASSLSRLVEKPEFLEREVYKLAAEVAGWSRSETKSRMQQVFARARAAASGGKVLWDGEWKDPRYNFTNQRIIEMLDITPEEETELRTIISDHSRLHRDRVRKERQRRAQGVQPRGEYLAEAKKKRRLARQMQRRGVSTAEIARRLECTPRHVSRLIK